MPEANVIPEHAEILGSDGQHVGIVDAIIEHRIKLTKRDSDDGKHHFLPISLVTDIKGNTVSLSVTAAEAIAQEESE